MLLLNTHTGMEERRLSLDETNGDEDNEKRKD